MPARTCRSILALLCPLLTLCLLAPLAHAEEEGDGGQARPSFYQFIWEGREIVASVEVNGVPVLEETVKASGTGGMPLNAWLKPGTNSLKVKLKPVAGADTPDFAGLLELAAPGQYSGQGTKLLSVSLPGPKPFEKSYAFTAEQAPATQLWAKAEQLNLDAGTAKEIRAFVAALATAYSKHDVNKLAKLLEFKAAEYGVALGGQTPTAAQIKDELKEYFADIKQRKLKFRPVSAAGLKLRLVGEGRLVLVSDMNDNPPIVAASADGSESQETKLYIARIGGAWVLAR